MKFLPEQVFRAQSAAWFERKFLGPQRDRAAWEAFFAWLDTADLRSIVHWDRARPL